MGTCGRLASWHLVEGPNPDDYTYACDDHIGAMRSDKTTMAYVIPEQYPCCYRAPARAEQLAALCEELVEQCENLAARYAGGPDGAAYRARLAALRGE